MRARSSNSIRCPAITAAAAPDVSVVMVSVWITGPGRVSPGGRPPGTPLASGPVPSSRGLGPVTWCAVSVLRRAIATAAGGLDHEQVPGADLDAVAAAHRDHAPVGPLHPVPAERTRPPAGHPVGRHPPVAG